MIVKQLSFKILVSCMSCIFTFQVSDTNLIVELSHGLLLSSYYKLFYPL